jgi:hypothetical protein
MQCFPEGTPIVRDYPSHSLNPGDENLYQYFPGHPRSNLYDRPSNIVWCHKFPVFQLLLQGAESIDVSRCEMLTLRLMGDAVKPIIIG